MNEKNSGVLTLLTLNRENKISRKHHVTIAQQEKRKLMLRHDRTSNVIQNRHRRKRIEETREYESYLHLIF